MWGKRQVHDKRNRGQEQHPDNVRLLIVNLSQQKPLIDPPANYKYQSMLSELEEYIRDTILLNMYRMILTAKEIVGEVYKIAEGRYTRTEIGKTINMLVNKGILCAIGISDNLSLSDNSKDCVFFTQAYMSRAFNDKEYELNWLMHKMYVNFYSSLRLEPPLSELNIDPPLQYTFFLEKYFIRYPECASNIETITVIRRDSNMKIMEEFNHKKSVLGC